MGSSSSANQLTVFRKRSPLPCEGEEVIIRELGIAKDHEPGCTGGNQGASLP